MAKKSVVARNKKRIDLVAKYADKRAALKSDMSDESLSLEERAAARVAFQKLPRDSSPVRVRNRCRITGRGQGVYKKFGLARTQLREAAMRGDVPGIRKASW